MKWRLSLAETLAFGSTVAVLTFWISSTFYTKTEQLSWKADIEGRIQSIETKIGSIENNVTGIRADVAYIRGRLEPKN